MAATRSRLPEAAGASRSCTGSALCLATGCRCWQCPVQRVKVALHRASTLLHKASVGRQCQFLTDTYCVEGAAFSLLSPLCPNACMSCKHVKALFKGLAILGDSEIEPKADACSGCLYTACFLSALPCSCLICSCFATALWAWWLGLHQQDHAKLTKANTVT